VLFYGTAVWYLDEKRAPRLLHLPLVMALGIGLAFSNARAVLEWAVAKGDKVLFFPDQHLGRNTGLVMGYGHDDMAVWNPRYEMGGMSEADLKAKTFLLWKGHCSVHQRFRPEHVEHLLAHPNELTTLRYNKLWELGLLELWLQLNGIT